MPEFDAIIIGAGQAGPSLAAPPDGSRQERRRHRAQALRRHLRQHRLHADQDAGRQRLCRAYGAARRRLRRVDRRPGPRRHEGGQGAQGRDRRRTRRSGVESWLRGMKQPARSTRATRASNRPHESRSADELLERDRDLHQRRRPRLRPRHARLDEVAYLTNSSHDGRRLPAPRISSSSAAATSGSNSRRCSAASAARSRSSRWRRA